MTAIASIGRAEFEGQIWPGDTQAVVVSWIDDHVSGSGHVAASAGSAGAAWFVVMVCGGVVLTRQMAGGTDRVAFGAQFSAMRIVAVAASDTARIHLAL